MNESTSPERPGSPWSDAEIQHARVGYQTAVSLWIYEGTLIWSKYNAMLVANSIVLAVTGFALDSHELSSTFKRALPIAGIVLCILWLQLTKRGFDQYVYWIMSARAIEEKYFPYEIKTVSRGGAYASGDPVRFTTMRPADRMVRPLVRTTSIDAEERRQCMRASTRRVGGPCLGL